MSIKFVPVVSFLVVTVIFISCQKVIDLDFENAKKRIVIEGVVWNGPGPYYVIIARSLNFNDSTYYDSVTDGSVVISDDMGNSDTLKMFLDGLYLTNTLQGIEGHTYKLFVSCEGQNYTSVCTMPYAVKMDTLRSQRDPTTDSGYALVPVYDDPAQVKNFYHFAGFEGSSPLSSIIRVRNDLSTDGQHVEIPVGFENYFNPGDTARFDFMCIDESVYQYFFGLSQTLSTGLNAPASPGNPPSNISGGCLGYFSAHTRESKTIVIQ